MTVSALCSKWIDRGGWREDRELCRCTFPIAPRNTWSNLAYPIMGLLLVIAQRTPTAWVMFGLMTYLGIGSFLYHGTKRKWANLLDRSGMYALFTGLVMFGYEPTNPATPWLMGIGGMLGGGLFLLLPVSLNVQMGMSLVLAILPAYMLGSPEVATVALLVFAASYGCWQLDKRTKLLGLWGHSLWHVGTAVAITLVYLAQGLNP